MFIIVMDFVKYLDGEKYNWKIKGSWEILCRKEPGTLKIKKNDPNGEKIEASFGPFDI